MKTTKINTKKHELASLFCFWMLDAFFPFPLRLEWMYTAQSLLVTLKKRRDFYTNECDNFLFPEAWMDGWMYESSVCAFDIERKKKFARFQLILTTTKKINLNSMPQPLCGKNKQLGFCLCLPSFFGEFKPSNPSLNYSFLFPS